MFNDVEIVILKWFKLVRDKNIFIFGFMLIVKVEEFVEKLDIINFKVFVGWFKNFKFR